MSDQVWYVFPVGYVVPAGRLSHEGHQVYARVGADGESGSLADWKSRAAACGARVKRFRTQDEAREAAGVHGVAA